MKRRGHYCVACDRYLANEKFSGKGHKNHICKKCKSKGRKPAKIDRQAQSPYDKEVNRYKKKVKNSFIYYAVDETYLLFEYQKELCCVNMSRTELLLTFDNTGIPPFKLLEKLSDPDAMEEVLFDKFHQCIESSQSIDDEDLEDSIDQTLKNKLKIFSDVLLAIVKYSDNYHDPYF